MRLSVCVMLFTVFLFRLSGASNSVPAVSFSKRSLLVDAYLFFDRVSDGGLEQSPKVLQSLSAFQRMVDCVVRSPVQSGNEITILRDVLRESPSLSALADLRAGKSDKFFVNMGARLLSRITSVNLLEYACIIDDQNESNFMHLFRAANVIGLSSEDLRTLLRRMDVIRIGAKIERAKRSDLIAQGKIRGLPIDDIKQLRHIFLSMAKDEVIADITYIKDSLVLTHQPDLSKIRKALLLAPHFISGKPHVMRFEEGLRSFLNCAFVRESTLFRDGLIANSLYNVMGNREDIPETQEQKNGLDLASELVEYVLLVPDDFNAMEECLLNSFTVFTSLIRLLEIQPENPEIHLGVIRNKVEAIFPPLKKAAYLNGSGITWIRERFLDEARSLNSRAQIALVPMLVIFIRHSSSRILRGRVYLSATSFDERRVSVFFRMASFFFISSLPSEDVVSEIENLERSRNSASDLRQQHEAFFIAVAKNSIEIIKDPRGRSLQALADLIALDSDCEILSDNPFVMDINVLTMAFNFQNTFQIDLLRQADIFPGISGRKLATIQKILVAFIPFGENEWDDLMNYSTLLENQSGEKLLFSHFLRSATDDRLEEAYGHLLMLGNADSGSFFDAFDMVGFVRPARFLREFLGQWTTHKFTTDPSPFAVAVTEQLLNVRRKMDISLRSSGGTPCFSSTFQDFIDLDSIVHSLYVPFISSLLDGEREYSRGTDICTDLRNLAGNILHAEIQSGSLDRHSLFVDLGVAAVETMEAIINKQMVPVALKTSIFTCFMKLINQVKMIAIRNSNMLNFGEHTESVNKLTDIVQELRWLQNSIRV